MSDVDSDSNGSRENGLPRGEETPRTRRRGAAKNLAEVAVVEDDEEGDENDLDDDMYIVEKIVTHMIHDDGTLKFQVKWEGYDDEGDLTWEPEENLKETAQEVIDEYFERIGGRDSIFIQTKKAVNGKKRGRPSLKGTEANAAKKARTEIAHPRESTPPPNRQWKPPAGSWEDQVKTVCDVNLEEDTKELQVFLEWKNGNKTKHKSNVVYQKCPQKMLQFYERHITIRAPEEVEA